MKLLIVDDSNVVRCRIARVVGSGPLADWQIVGLARNGADAVRLCAELKPDVVTMDLTMPEMDGIECIPRILEGHPDLLILVVSALSDKATAIEALKRGAHGFLYKPFSDEQLINGLTHVVQ